MLLKIYKKENNYLDYQEKYNTSNMLLKITSNIA